MMNKYIIFFLAVILYPVVSNATDPLIYENNLTYLGGFRLPVDPVYTNETLWKSGYSGTVIAFRPAREGYPNGTLYMDGEDARIKEISIPNENTFSTSSSASAYPRSALVQDHIIPYAASDIDCYFTGWACPGDTGFTGAAPAVLGGLIVVGDKLIGTLYDTYNYAPDQEKSHFVSPLTLSTSASIGPFGPTTTATPVGADFSPLGRYVSGHLTPIPSAYQTALGGDILTGLSDRSIIASTSYGPTVFSMNSADIVNEADRTVPFTVTPLMYVGPSSHHTVYPYWGEAGSGNPAMSSSDKSNGVVFPEGTRSVLFFARHGSGDYCYGSGCYDPEMPGTGQHTYPYTYQIIAYDADDLAAVKAGTKQHNALIPYDSWEITFPTAHTLERLMGATYDPNTQRIFVTQYGADGTAPIVHVFHLDIDSITNASVTRKAGNTAVTRRAGNTAVTIK
jgi:hypothetical protein